VELIATHVGADFDAFAAMLAARKLHPGAEMFFPGSREEPLRRMLATGLVEFSEVKQKQIDPLEIERVVLCDIRQRRRIGVLAEWLAARPEVPVLAYDHHPDSDDDLPLAGGRVDPTVGAASTLMVEELSARGLELTAAEATVLLLGIYEDTGSLTYSATSPRDHRAAAWLLDRGGDLAAVRRWATFRLDTVHLEVLHRMMRQLEVVRLRGHRVGVVGIELGEFVDELAPLVSRALELADLPLLFALFGDGEAVQVIARGEVAGVDLGDVLAELGGGGHRTAAAARVHGRTVIEVREGLLERLGAVLPPAARASDLAIADFLVVAAGTSVVRAKEQLVERRVNSAPVAAAGEAAGTAARLAGAVTRQMLDAALQHGMGERPVERVMEADLEWVAPDAPAEEVGRRMLDRHPRFVLVGDRAAGRAVGLISRMQVLRHLHARLAAEEMSLDRAEHLRVRTTSATKLLAGLPRPLARRVETAARLSRQHRIPVHLVGGLVRDLLLGRENRDLDLVVEGDGPHFAHLLAGELGGRVREHRAFLTAVVVDAEGFHTDVATARSEFYRQPAALPEVTSSALRQDLYRRDFTINTLAIRLGPDSTPELVDSFGGGRDLGDGVIRVLHSLSFLDDPTRVLRAVRLEQRLGFTIAPETLHLVEVALEEGAFDRLSGSRLREELILLLDEPGVALAGLERLAELDLLAVLHPELRLDDEVRRRLEDAVGAFHWFRLEGLTEPEVRLWRLLLVALTLDMAPERVERLAERLMIAGEHRAVITGAAGRLAAARAALARPAMAPHEVSATLADLPGEDLLLLLGGGPEPVRERVRRDLTELRAFRLEVRGADLVAAGVEPGPAIGEALQATREARLDGVIAAEQELEHALAAARERAAGAPRGVAIAAPDAGGVPVAVEEER
jgi:tRNA nucleotidyltransferase (CCA-adding enzyme)